MPNYSEDRCSVCGKLTSPELLTVKRAVFVARADGRKQLKSRTTDWKCPSCLNKDPDWHQEKFKAPGHTSAPLERVRNNNK